MMIVLGICAGLTALSLWCFAWAWVMGKIDDIDLWNNPMSGAVYFGLAFPWAIIGFGGVAICGYLALSISGLVH